MPNATHEDDVERQQEEDAEPDDPGQREPGPEAVAARLRAYAARRAQTPALNSAQAFCQSVWPAGVSSVSGYAAVEVALADDRGLQVRGDDAVRDEPVRVELRERRLVADVVREVVVAVLLVEQVVEEVVREDGVLRVARDREHVVADRSRGRPAGTRSRAPPVPVPSGRYHWAEMALPDHIWCTQALPSGRFV